MFGLSESERFRKNFKLWRRRQIVAETKIAKLKKEEQTAMAQGQYVLGTLAEIAGWPEIDEAEIQRRIINIIDTIEQADDLTHFQKMGDRLFDQHKQKRKGTMQVTSAAVQKAKAGYIVSIGEQFIEHGLAIERKSVLLGIMASMRQLSDN